MYSLVFDIYTYDLILTYTSLCQDDLRLREKRLTDGKIISILGVTEFGTIYEIKLVPTLVHQWAEWNKKIGHSKQDKSTKLYQDILKKQDEVDQLTIA